MRIIYQDYIAEVIFCRITNGFYGEVINSHNHIIFLANKKKELIMAMQQAIELHSNYTAVYKLAHA